MGGYKEWGGACRGASSVTPVRKLRPQQSRGHTTATAAMPQQAGGSGSEAWLGGKRSRQRARSARHLGLFHHVAAKTHDQPIVQKHGRKHLFGRQPPQRQPHEISTRACASNTRTHTDARTATTKQVNNFKSVETNHYRHPQRITSSTTARAMKFVTIFGASGISSLAREKRKKNRWIDF